MTWITTEMHQSISGDYIFRIFPEPIKNGRFVAVQSLIVNNNLFEHVIGFFKTVAEAKAACEMELKELSV